MRSGFFTYLAVVCFFAMLGMGVNALDRVAKSLDNIHRSLDAIETTLDEIEKGLE